MAIATCTHIKVTGVPCKSPALRGHEFCYFHQRVHRGVRTPPQARLHPIAVIEDEESIQASLMEVINALMRNTIDLKCAELILRALHIAVKNARRVKFHAYSRDVVREIPEYAPPAASTEQADFAEAIRIPLHNPHPPRPGYIRNAAELIRDGVVRPRTGPTESGEDRTAQYYGYPNAAAYAAALAAQAAQAKSQAAEPPTANPNSNAAADPVGTDSPAFPGKPQVRSAVDRSHDIATRLGKKPSAAAKSTPPPAGSRARHVSAG